MPRRSCEGVEMAGTKIMAQTPVASATFEILFAVQLSKFITRTRKHENTKKIRRQLVPLAQRDLAAAGEVPAWQWGPSCPPTSICFFVLSFFRLFVIIAFSLSWRMVFCRVCCFFWPQPGLFFGGAKIWK